mgnify:CR=1 FL=1
MSEATVRLIPSIAIEPSAMMYAPRAAGASTSSPLDQLVELLVYAPVYLFAAGGTWLMLRQREWRWLGGILLAAVAGLALIWP